MKFALSFKFFLWFMVATLTASSPVWAAPRLTFDNPAFDFGKVTQGKTVEHAFTFRNTGDAPITIQRVGSSCGCTVATPSSQVIHPGKSGEIKAAFDSSDFRGEVTKEVFVYTANPQKPSHTLTMKGMVVEEIVITPNQLNLGDVKPGVRKDGILKIENKGNRVLKIKAVRSILPQMTASSDKKVLRPGETAAIRVSLTPKGDRRFINGYITIVTDSPTKPEKEVAIFSVLKK
ncbi:MAG: DUF1573 domain-containing protein [Deltaproteobacteria bacterium]|nr:DUF1573 domain-containing protein [Deltaproteobacteria bacterium]